MSISVKQARCILEKDGEQYTTEEVEKILEFLNQIAMIAYEDYAQKNWSNVDSTFKID